MVQQPPESLPGKLGSILAGLCHLRVFVPCLLDVSVNDGIPCRVKRSRTVGHTEPLVRLVGKEMTRSRSQRVSPRAPQLVHHFQCDRDVENPILNSKAPAAPLCRGRQPAHREFKRRPTVRVELGPPVQPTPKVSGFVTCQVFLRPVVGVQESGR